MYWLRKFTVSFIYSRITINDIIHTCNTYILLHTLKYILVSISSPKYNLSISYSAVDRAVDIFRCNKYNTLTCKILIIGKRYFDHEKIIYLNDPDGRLFVHSRNIPITNTYKMTVIL